MISGPKLDEIGANFAMPNSRESMVEFQYKEFL